MSRQSNYLKKYLFVICVVVALASLAANVRFLIITSNLHDDLYGVIAQNHKFNIELSNHLQTGKVGAAQALLSDRIEQNGNLLAICLLEDCSDQAQAILQKEP